MRTTLTLDGDVAAALERVRKAENLPFKQVVNDLLRAGLQQREAQKKPTKPFRTKVHHGGLLIPPETIKEFLAELDDAYLRKKLQ